MLFALLPFCFTNIKGIKYQKLLLLEMSVELLSSRLSVFSLKGTSMFNITGDFFY